MQLHPSLSAGRLSNEAYRIWQRKKTQVEMLEDRGYTIPEAELLAISTGRRFVNYFDQVEGNLDMIYERSRDNDRLSVVYNLETKGTKKKQLQDLMNKVDGQYESGEAEEFIIITISPLNESWLKKLKFSVQVFNYDDLALNPTRHALNPQFSLLSEKQRSEFYRRTKILPRQMPGISLHDPIVKYYGGKLDDVFKIVRPTLLDYYVPNFVYYREVRDVSLAGITATSTEGEGEGDEEAEGGESPEGEIFE